MKKSISLILAVLLTLCVVSCNQNPPNHKNEPTTPTVIFGRDVAVYNNMVFYRDDYTRELKYQDMENIQSTGFNLYQDLLETDENPFKHTTAPTAILVDPIATKKNNGAPVLYIALNRLDHMVVSYNTATQQMRILKKDLTGRLMNLLLYGEHLVFSTHEGDLGTRIHTIKTDGTDYCTLENPDKLTLDIESIWNGEIYFTNGTGNLYKAPLSLDSFSLVLDDCFGSVFFSDNDLYYNEMSTSHLCRVPLNDLSAKETVIDQPVGGIAQGSLYIYKLNDDDRSVYLYYAKTNENQMVYQNGSTKAYRCFSETYICFKERNKKLICYYDIAAKEEIEIPY